MQSNSDILQVANISTKESYFDQLSPRTQTIIRKLLGIGVSIYIGHIILTSPEFKYTFSKLTSWGILRIRPVLPLIIADSASTYFDVSRVNLLLELPGKIRQRVWSMLLPRDLQSVRLVCKRFQWDIDYTVGVHAFIDSRSIRSFNWFKTIAIQTCTVHHLKNLKKWDFLAKPQIVTTIKMNDVCAITPEIFGIILKKCSNLRNLSIHFRDDGFSNDENNKIIFEALEGRRFSLILLDVNYIPSYRTCHWTMKFEKPSKRRRKEAKEDLEKTAVKLPKPNKPVDEKKCLKLPSSTKYLNLNFEHYSGFDGLSYSKNRFFWKKFLENQINLKVLICNFGPVCWDVYAQVIRRNYTTLEKISLSNVCCWDFWDLIEDCECPFNWNFFAPCQKLGYLSMACENGPKFGPAMYTPIEPVIMHLRVLYCNFGLVFWGIYMSIVETNLNTLEDVTLLRMTNWDKVNSEESPFDWNLFSQCGILRNLMIGGEHLTFLETINFESIPVQNLKKFQLYWIALTSENVSHMIKYMPQLNNTFEFLDWCSIDKIYRSDNATDIINRYQYRNDWYSSMDIVKRVVSSLPLVELAVTTWLVFVKPEG